MVFDLTDGSGCGKNASVARPHRIATIPWRVQGKLAKTLRRDCVALTLRELVAADLLGIAGGDARRLGAATMARGESKIITPVGSAGHGSRSFIRQHMRRSRVRLASLRFSLLFGRCRLAFRRADQMLRIVLDE